MTQNIPIVENILNANDRLAQTNRAKIDAAGVFSINILASPGAGKTSLIEKTLPLLKGRLRVAAIDGDIATSIDSDRAAAAGAGAAVQINTGGDCHLDAVMLHGALDQLDLTQFDLLIVENVGNLVCPANFKLGTHKTVLVASIPEGDDKPYKYPGTYRGVDVLVVNKIDLLPYVDFRMDYFQQGVQVLNPNVTTFHTSCRTGEGLQAWADWLVENAKKIMQGAKVHITGIVQGVGFRPFVYNLAVSLNLKGWVKNTSAGVHIEVDGDQETLDIFLQKLRDDAPPLSRIDDFSASFGPGNGFTQFDIIHSESVDGAFQPISPDVAICDDCLRELFDPTDRRYRYPFINCTNCGPRFTIIQDIPYDRPFTTMAGFPLCPDCEREYKDPTNRRFHAQPVACAVCGPKVWLEMQNAEVGGQNTEGRRQKAEGGIQNDEAVVETQRLLAEGKIVAIKGLGGFHLACDATNASAVTELRTRKLRVDKPFALMMPDLETIEQHCFVSDEEKALLTSPAHPIVLLKKKPESTIVEEVSPKQDWLGVMLPYTPLHYLLFSNQHSPISALVMTSGNLSEEPIATDNAEARERLANLADAFLMHDRDIHVRCDDSVVRVFSEQSPITNHQLPITYPIRRSRGYSPFPVKLPFEVPPLLATGSELKNTFCLTNRNYAFLSHHIGDMENYETLKSFEQGVEHFERLFRVKPVAIAHDMHPNYLATRYALERAERENLPTFAIQHHYAHVAACMAEHGLSEPVIGVSFDGTGYGDDGAIWGGEFLVADYKSYQRAAHLEYFPLPGGDAAIKKPARAALALLWSLGMDWDDALESVKEFCAEDQVVLRVQLEKKINTPMTSSMGRLFDAVSALAGVRQKVNYEGQAAIEFEAMVDSAEAGHYAFGVESGQVRVRSVVEALVKDVMAGVSTSKISARFHHGLAEAVCETVQKIHGETSLRKVILSGGVWQNLTLLRRTLSLLREDGFEVYIHREVPTNDGGLSLGQAAIAAFRLRG